MKVLQIPQDLAEYFRKQEKRIKELERQAGITDVTPWTLNEPEWEEVEKITDNIVCLLIRFNIPISEYNKQIRKK